ncbi:hypothetical protein BDZ89DRAFT_1156369 [Hymenopellis radicata]|nr:hypothetical protein BDZ89DRAFT_1156369 [Hymenopellis radicata]
MILPSPSETSKPGLPLATASGPGSPPGSAGLPPPPPCHPSLHYGRSSSPIPPTYQVLVRPVSTIVYNFGPSLSPLDQNSMLLYAPHATGANQKGAREPYHISVNMNCFTPTSFITTIRKSSCEGDVIGDFEIGPSNSRISNTVCLGGNEYSINDILTSYTKFFKNSWTWKTVSRSDKLVTLTWDDNAGGGTLNCFTSKERTQANFLAKFTPRNLLRRAGRPVQYPKLEVTPTGHDYFDDILMSALIIERLRTDPPP